MRGFRQMGRVLASLMLFLLLTGLAWAANGAGWQITLSQPTAGSTFAPGATIGVYNGTYSWTKTDDSISDIAMYVLTESSNPDVGTQVSSNYANDTPKNNGDGSGSGTFNSQNVTPALTATTNKGYYFYVSAVPENASSGRYYPNGTGNPPLLDSKKCSTSG